MVTMFLLKYAICLPVNHTLYGQTEPLLKVNTKRCQAVSHYIRTQPHGSFVLTTKQDKREMWGHDSVNNEAWGHGIHVWNHREPPR